MIDDLTPLLRDLPEPAPHSSMTASVMARIEREAERKAEARSATRVKATGEVRVLFLTVAGLALVGVLFAYGWLSLETPPDFTSPRIGFDRARLVPIQGPAMWLVGVGLVIYLAGLFAPLRSGERDSP
jgi:hypothetical protein